jgi:thioredoxin 1
MKFLSRIFFGFIFGILSAGALAGEMAFDQKVFDELRAAGKPVVVHTHAQWCGICKKQARLVTPMLADPEFKDLTLMRADYDKEDALLKSLRVSTKSTFIVFKGGTEAGRSTGDTNKDSIAALFRKAL